jgi:hypothetical protein
LRIGRHQRHQREGAVGEHHAGWGAELREAGGEATAARIGPLAGHQYRPAPLAADAQPLQDAADREQYRAPDANDLVGRDQPDADRCNAHHHHGDDEERFAADAVAEMAEQRRAERPRQEPDEKGREREQRADERIRARKELLREDRGGGDPVQKEVVPLDGRPRSRCRNGAHLLPPTLGRIEQSGCIGNGGVAISHEGPVKLPYPR